MELWSREQAVDSLENYAVLPDCISCAILVWVAMCQVAQGIP